MYEYGPSHRRESSTIPARYYGLTRNACILTLSVLSNRALKFKYSPTSVLYQFMYSEKRGEYRNAGAASMYCTHHACPPPYPNKTVWKQQGRKPDIYINIDLVQGNLIAQVLMAKKMALRLLSGLVPALVLPQHRVHA